MASRCQGGVNPDQNLGYVRPDDEDVTVPYELFLQLEEIEHRTTRVKRPQSNGIVERLHRTLLDEHFRVEGRRTWFDTVEEMQTVLDRYLEGYNHKRPHQGRGMNGRTPAKAFKDGLPKTPVRKEVTSRRSVNRTSSCLIPAQAGLSGDYPLCTPIFHDGRLHA